MEIKQINSEDAQEEQFRKLAEQAKKERADRKRKEEEAKKKLPPPKFYYDIRVECMLPATLTYRVLAETPEQAADMIKNMSPVSVKHKLIGRKELKLLVYDAGCSFLKFVRNLGRL